MALTVPVIDLSSSSTPAQIDAAASTIGFFQITNHGMDPAVIDGLRDAVDDIFSLPLATKLRYPPPGPEVDNGYSTIGVESLAYSLGIEAPPDLRSVQLRPGGLR